MTRIQFGNALQERCPVGGRGQQIGRLVHAGPVFEADHDHGLAPGAVDDDRFVVVVHTIHYRGEIGAKLGGGEGFHGGGVRDCVRRVKVWEVGVRRLDLLAVSCDQI
jgi:hypothetical protein